MADSWLLHGTVRYPEVGGGADEHLARCSLCQSYASHCDDRIQVGVGALYTAFVQAGCGINAFQVVPKFF